MLSAAASVALLRTATAPMYAEPCKDTKGRFSGSPQTKNAPARCKDVNDKFTKCSAVPAKPM